MLPDHGATQWLTARGNPWHLKGTAVMGATWALTSSRLHLPRGVLGVLDAGGVLLTSLAFLMVGWDLRARFPGAHVALLAITNLTVARAVLVPSPALRTLWITALASLPV